MTANSFTFSEFLVSIGVHYRDTGTLKNTGIAIAGTSHVLYRSIPILRYFLKIISEYLDTSVLAENGTGIPRYFRYFKKCTGDTPILSINRTVDDPILWYFLGTVPVMHRYFDTFQYLYRCNSDATILSINNGTGAIQILYFFAIHLHVIKTVRIIRTSAFNKSDGRQFHSGKFCHR